MSGLLLTATVVALLVAGLFGIAGRSMALTHHVEPDIGAAWGAVLGPVGLLIVIWSGRQRRSVDDLPRDAADLVSGRRETTRRGHSDDDVLPA